MNKLIEVLVYPDNEVISYESADSELEPRTRVVVKTEGGFEMGEVVSISDSAPDDQGARSVIRRATSADMEKQEKNQQRADEAQRACKEQISSMSLNMKLVDTQISFNASRIVFRYTAEERVDFRALVKNLASRFKSRIEMKQIGVRDGAAVIGGLGLCGRNLCCDLLNGECDPVSIRMAKEQDLPLNPNKISGSCGRLMCCLRYEYDVYTEFRKKAPSKGSEVQTPDGNGIVTGYNVPKDSLTVRMDGGWQRCVPLEDCQCTKRRRNN